MALDGRHSKGGARRPPAYSHVAILFFCIFLAETLSIPRPAAAQEKDYLSGLVLHARQGQLAQQPEWRALLHYQPRFLAKGDKSQIVSESFFTTPQGRYDPEAELEGTLTAFLAPAGAAPDNSAQCEFAARYHWLAQTLGLDPERVPPLSCNRFRKWFDGIKAERLTLVFPAAYLNNPASMFGHTLLRIDSRGENEQTRLLANTVNYAAETDRKPGMMYALKGLFGGYRGKFSVAPYYLEVKEYGDIENRDIWEYELNLTPAEIDQLLRHLWELRSAYFDYYFLDENCSYQLLSLLEAARPGLRLTDRFKLWAIPSETVRAVMEAGLVREVRFRPARTTILRERARRLDSRLQTLARRLATGELKADTEELRDLAPVEQAQVIELAVDYAVYRRTPGFGRLTESTGDISELLEARSRVAAPDQTPAITRPSIPPGAGHKPARASLGYGIEKGRQFLEVTMAPGYHDIFDPDGGFTHGARIMGLSGAVRYYPNRGDVELERFDIIDIMSTPSWGRFLHPISWKINLGVGRKFVDASDRPLFGRISVGAGLSHDFSERTWAFVLAEGTVEMSDRYAWFVAPGIGPAAGIIHDVTQSWRSGLFFLGQFFFLHEWRDDYETTFRNRIAINLQNAVGCDLAWKREFGNSFALGKIYWQYYF